jgi:hypothetical protein
MARRTAEQSENNPLVSAARVVGTALGKVKRLTDAASAVRGGRTRGSAESGRSGRKSSPASAAQGGTSTARQTASGQRVNSTQPGRPTTRPAGAPSPSVQATGQRGRASGQAQPARATRRVRPVTLATDDDVVGGPQAGGSRSPRQTETSRRGKSRTKRSKGRKASRRH